MSAKIEILKLPKYLMTYSGSWRHQIFKNPFAQYLYNVYSFIIQSYYTSFVVGFLIDLCNSTYSEKIVENLGYSIISSVIMTKLLICQSKENTQIVKDMIVDEQRILNSGYPDVKKSYQGYLKYCSFLNRVLAAFSCVACLVFCFANYLEYKKVVSEKMDNKPLPLPIWLPFNTDKYYGFAFTICLGFAIIGSTYNCITQMFIISLMVYATSQLKGLQLYFKNFDRYAEQYMQDVNIKEVLKIYIEKHKSSIRLVEKLNDEIKNVLLLEFLLNSLNLASLMFQLIAKTNPTSFMMFYLMFFLTLIIQIFFLAWSTDSIQKESEALSMAIFESNWFKQSEENKKTLHIVMMRAQRPLRLTIGPFGPMSLGTAVTTIKAAYSYITFIVGKSKDQ